MLKLSVLNKEFIPFTTALIIRFITPITPFTAPFIVDTIPSQMLAVVSRTAFQASANPSLISDSAVLIQVFTFCQAVLMPLSKPLIM